MRIGKIHLACPRCDLPVPVMFDARMDDFEVGNLIAEPDLTDVWAHAWTHNQETTP